MLEGDPREKARKVRKSRKIPPGEEQGLVLRDDTTPGTGGVGFRPTEVAGRLEVLGLKLRIRYITPL